MPLIVPKSSIPKIIHRVWLSGEPLPGAAQEFIAGWERLHPNWEQRLWTSDNLAPLVNQTLYDSTDKFWAKKTDIFALRTAAAVWGCLHGRRHGAAQKH